MMHPRSVSLATLIALAILLPSDLALACTTFLQSAGTLVGKSYDWHDGSGQVLMNPRGLEKRALVMDPRGPLEWTSRHASLTFNQYGREMPNGGINEAGLVVEVMWLRDTAYPAADKRPAVNELQFVQYLLDTRSTVAEVVAGARDVRVSPLYAAIHWLACDPTGHCAALEYLAGRLVVTDRPSHQTLTNNPYAQCADHVASASRPDDGSRGSLARFARAAARATAPGAAEGGVTAAFATLDSVSQGTYSKWQIVYEPKTRAVHWRTHGQRAIKSARLGPLAAGCDHDARLLDMNHASGGDVTAAFATWTNAENKAQVSRAVTNLRGPKSLRLLIPVAAAYPASLRCSLP